MEGIIKNKRESEQIFKHLTNKMVQAPHFDEMDKLFMTEFDFFEGAHYNTETRFIMIYYVRGLKVPYLLDDEDISIIKRFIKKKGK